LPTKKSAPRDFAEPCRRKFFVRQGKGSFAYWAYACHGVVWKAVL